MFGKCILLAAGLALLACSDSPSGPGAVDHLRIVQSPASSDTITAEPSQPMVVQVFDADGRPQAGIEVRFHGLQPEGMRVSPTASAPFVIAANVVTDGNGRAAVRLQFGTRARPTPLQISVPLYAVTDTTHFTTQPGNTTELHLAPRDTVIGNNSSFAFRVAANDRTGNATTTSPNYTVSGLAATVSGAGVVSAHELGIVSVVARLPSGTATIIDSTRLAVAPAARIILAVNQELQLRDLNGGARRSLGFSGSAPSWEPGTARFVFTAEALIVADTLGQADTLLTAAQFNASWAQWSSDGWIYFEGERKPSSIDQIYRIRPNGTSLELLADFGSAPTVSPDGSQVAFVMGYNLAVMNVATRQVRFLGNYQTPNAPRWSPNGAWIAFTSGGQLMRIQADGLNLETVVPNSFLDGVSWSPDSRWIIAQRGGITLVDVTTQRVMEMAWPGQFPAWRP